MTIVRLPLVEVSTLRGCLSQIDFILITSSRRNTRRYIKLCSPFAFAKFDPVLFVFSLLESDTSVFVKFIYGCQDVLFM